MAGVIIMQLISVLDKGISYSSLLGILCGALTSTPGLSSVCELVGTDSEEAVLGYGYSYLFGVIFVVIFVQILSCSVAEKVLPKTKSPSTTGNIYPELILINITALFGNILGTLHIPFLHISIGNTASTLLIGLTVGYIVQRNFANVQISSHIINSFKNLGLALFFTGTGFASGLQSVAFDIKSVLYGALITLTAILFGWMLCKIVSIRCLLHNGFVIAGGMTSSPAYGTIRSKASENSINQFSFAYFGALISLVIAIQIIGR